MIRSEKGKAGAIVGSLILICIVIFIVMNLLSDYYNFQEILQEYKGKAEVIYFMICFLHPILLPVVREAVTAVAGCSVLGSFKGAVIGFSGTVSGIACMFLLSRFAGEKISSKFINSEKIEKFNKYIEKNETWIILTMFIFPIMPDEVICAGSGLSHMSTHKFLIIAAIGKLITQFSLAYSIQIIKVDTVSIIILILFLITALLVKSRFKAVDKL